jgi:hypothetical protein
MIYTIINLGLHQLQTAQEIDSNSKLEIPGNKHPRTICTTPHIISLVQYLDRMINYRNISPMTRLKLEGLLVKHQRYFNDVNEIFKWALSFAIKDRGVAQVRNLDKQLKTKRESRIDYSDDRIPLLRINTSWIKGEQSSPKLLGLPFSENREFRDKT